MASHNRSSTPTCRPSRSAGQRACINEIAEISPAMTEKRVGRIQYNRVMRPAILNPLFASLTTLPGIGPKLETLYARLLGRETPRIVDLLFHLPSGAIDRRARPKLREVQSGQVVTVAVNIDKHRPAPPHRPRAPYQIYASDETGTLTVTYFNARRDYLEKLFPVGGTRYVSGSAEFYDGMPQMVHPDRVVDEKGFAALPLVEPGYAPTEGISLTGARRALAA